MRQRTIIAVLIFGMIPATSSFAQVLQMGIDAVAWEANNATMLTADTGPLLYRQVPEADFVSVKAKISAQTAGFWSQAGVIVRAPNPIDGAGAQENWVASWSFRAPDVAPFSHQANMSTLGVEAELNNGNLSASDLNYMRLDNMGGGVFQAYRGTGPDSAIVWTPLMDANMMPNPQTNANLSGIPLQVGVAGGAIGALAGASVLFDWVEIQTTSQTFRDDFNYTRDFSVSGVPVGGIWTGVENAAAGGVNTQSGNVGRCSLCTWNTDGSGDFGNLNNWLGDTNPVILFAPNATDATVVFGASSVAGPAVVYTNQNVTVKQIDFDNATNPYVLGGAGSVTLDSNSGNALINVLNGAHEIQAKLILADNVTATAAAGTSLNINAAVVLNGKSFMTAGAGVINLNNGTIAVGGAGGGSLVNDGNLSGLAAVEGNYTQTGGGSLAVELGSGSIAEVLGTADLDGTLNVSLAAGFAPTNGESYTILTASSVTNSGLSLVGEAANLFRLSVDGNSVSLLAVPEPTSVLLMMLGMAGVLRLRRQRQCPGWIVREGVSASRVAGLVVGLTLLGAAAAEAEVLTYGPANQPVTYRDEFNSFFNYEAANGGVPTGTFTSSLGGTKSWTSVYNAQNGGDRATFPDFPAVFQANGEYEGVPAPGMLIIQDQAIHPNTSGDLGVGWESGETNAPFLHANVDAGDNFEATVKISTQTAGNWSYAGLIARRAGPTPGAGIGDVVDPTEAFVTTGRFSNTLDNVATPEVDESLSATILTQNIGDLDTDGTLDEFESQSAAIVGRPLWVRLKKESSRYTTSTSVDGITFTNQTQVINPLLNTAGQLLDLGPMFVMHPTAPSFGVAQFDFFEITVSKQLVPRDARWAPVAAGLGSGDWNNLNNWDSDTAPGLVPNLNSVDVTLGSGNATFGPATVYHNAAVTIRSLSFDSANKYAISGTGSITLEPDALHPVDTDAVFIHVDSGSHEIQVDMGLSSATAGDNRIVAQPGTRLDVNNTFNINGKSLFIQGGGKVNFNNNIDTGTAGTVTINAGNLGGSGRVNANLRNGDATNAGGILSPGQSVGTLTVDGSFTQHSTGTLEIELGGTAAGQFDRLNVLTVATLDGLLDVKYANGFLPTAANLGQTWDVITAPTMINSLVISLDPSDSPYYSLTCVNCGAAATPDILRLTLTAVPTMGLIGDYNNNGKVDAADYTLWRNALGTNTVLQNRNPANMGNISAADYATWKLHFGESLGAGSGLGGGNSAVPEPAAIMLLLFGAAMIGSSKLRRPRSLR